MNYTLEKKEKFTLITLPEIFDGDVSDPLKKKLIEIISNGTKNIIFDMSLTRYCDSAGLSAILTANRLCKNSNGLFLLINVCDAIKKLLTIAQVVDLLSIRTSLQEAEEFINDSAKEDENVDIK